MQLKHVLTFHEVKHPITQPITKFGGQPVWLTEPQWPLSRSEEEPMQFICQIVLEPSIFGNISGRVAYLFITGDETPVDNMFDPNGGENAVIIQPGTYDGPTQPLLTGPTLYKMVRVPTEKYLVPIESEWSIELSTTEDPDIIEKSEDMDREEYVRLLSENKIGGTPVFLQFREFPDENKWRLLLELDPSNLPFYLNFGDAGIGYAFLSEDGDTGKFLWQCL